MRKFCTAFLLLCGFALFTSGELCTDSPTLPSQYLCSNTNEMAPTGANGFSSWPALGSNALSFTFSAKILDACSLASTTPLHFLIVSITGDGSTRNVFDGYYGGSSANNLVVTTVTSSGSTVTVLTTTITSTLAVGDWVEFSGSISLAASGGKMKGGAGVASKLGQVERTGLSYSSWKFDSTTKFTWCSDSTGTSKFSCQIKDLKVWYSYMFGYADVYLGGSPNTLLGYFPLDENTGTTLNNKMSSSTTMANGYFGDSASSPTPATLPTWSPTDLAVKFTASTQYVTLPNFVSLPSNDLTSASFTVVGYVKINSVPSSNAHIFSILSSDLSVLKFSIIVTSTLQFGYIAGGGTPSISSATSKITAGGWNVLFAAFQLRSDLSYTRAVIQIGPYYIDNYYTMTPAQRFTFSNTDVVRLGGPNTFIGEIGNIRVFSPGSTVLRYGSCNNNVWSEIAITSPPTPLECNTNNYLSENTCVPCPSRHYSSLAPQPTSCLPCVAPCNECYSTTECIDCPANYFYKSTDYSCNQCASGTYSAGGTVASCTNCVSPCATCQDASTCITCVPGNYFYASRCYTPTACPATTYPDSTSQRCIACVAPCSSCSSSSACTSCRSGFYLSGTECVVASSCPSNTYADSGTSRCANCVSPCLACSSSSACTSCVSNYYLTGTQCVTSTNCPSRTYPDSGTQTCKSCESPCFACTSSSACTSCISNRYLTGTQCVASSSCPSNTYADSGTSTCANCVSPCLACSGSSTCRTCVSNYYLTGTQCVTSTSCPSGTYPDGGTQTCAKCVSPCSDCTSSSDCTSCVRGYDLSGTECVRAASCPAGTYRSSSGSACLQCADPCGTCENSPVACTSCQSGYTLSGNTCKKEASHTLAITLGVGLSVALVSSGFIFAFRYRKLKRAKVSIVKINQKPANSPIEQRAVSPSVISPEPVPNATNATPPMISVDSPDAIPNLFARR